MADSFTTTIFAVLGLLMGAGGLGTVLVQTIGKRVKTPADENERTKLGNEFLRSLLEDARKEREELRMTIDELRALDVKNTEAIRRLQTIADSKDDRIRELESRQAANAAKLQAGHPLTLADILGTTPPGLNPDLEVTQIP